MTALAARLALPVVWIALAALAPAQRTDAPMVQRYDPTQDVGIDQRLGERLPLDALFVDRAGADVELGRFFGARPVVLAFVYYECPMLCTLVLNGVLDAARVLKLDPGVDYELVLVSIDPEEGPALAAAKADRFVRALERDGAASGVHFLTGTQPAIDAVATAAGFRYVYDERSGEFAHASGLMVATRDGRLSRYLYGVEYSPRDLRLSLVEASEGTIGSFADQVLLLCYHYDPTTGEYGFAIMTAIRTLGALTLLVLLGFVLRSLRRERKGGTGRRGPAQTHAAGEARA